VKLQGGATTPSRAKRGGCGGSLEDELCPDKVEGWTAQVASPVVLDPALEIMPYASAYPPTKRETCLQDSPGKHLPPVKAGKGCALTGQTPARLVRHGLNRPAPFLVDEVEKLDKDG
jgi:hypothetical protein